MSTCREITDLLCSSLHKLGLTNPLEINTLNCVSNEYLNHIEEKNIIHDTEHSILIIYLLYKDITNRKKYLELIKFVLDRQCSYPETPTVCSQIKQRNK